MNILQQIWTYSTVFSNFLVNLVHAVALVPVIDHDVVAVGETVQLFTVPSVNGGQIAVAVVVVAHQFLTIEGDGSEAVRRRRERRFSRGRLKIEISCAPHTLYVGTEGFIQATVCFFSFERKF